MRWLRSCRRLISDQGQAAQKATIDAGLVTINSGPIAHSMALTAVGLDVCRLIGLAYASGHSTAVVAQVLLLA